MLEYVTIRNHFIPQHILSHLLTLTDSVAYPTSTGHGSTQSVNSEYRDTGRHKIPSQTLVDIESTTRQIHKSLLAPKYHTSLRSVEEPQLLSYGPGGKYDPHNDSEDFVDNRLTRVVPRDWTMIWYLNKDYEGGKLDFCKLGITFNPKAGDMIIFPSYAEFEHAVTPVTRGVRKCLVIWIETDRRVYER
jgi:hypothetical protein